MAFREYVPHPGWPVSVAVMAVGLAGAYHLYWPLTVTPHEAWRWLLSAVLFVLTALGIVWFHLVGPDLPDWTDDVTDARCWALFWATPTVPMTGLAVSEAVVTGQSVIPAVVRGVTLGTLTAVVIPVSLVPVLAVGVGIVALHRAWRRRSRGGEV